MKRYLDPTPALKRTRPELSRGEWVCCIVTVALIVGALIASMWMDHWR